MSEDLQDLQELEISIEEAKAKIERKQALTRLQDNKDFDLLIQKGFLEQHAIRQVMLKSHPGMQGEELQRTLDNQIVAIGGFKQYLISIWSEGTSAAEALEADEATLEEIMQGGE